MSTNSPIFIVGTPRSGTTLTARILGRHSRLFMPGETHFFYDIYSRRRELGDLENAASVERILERMSTLYARYNEPEDQARIDSLFSEPTVRERLRQCRSYPDLLTTFMQIQTEREGKVRWGNNAPRDIFHIGEILKFYPDAKVIVCVRDVRDFLSSYKWKWRATSPEHVERLKRIYHPVVTSMLWKSSIRLIPFLRETVNSTNLFVLKYESLVTSPERTVRAICDVIEEEFEPGILNIDSHNSSFSVDQGHIFSGSVGRWRDSLSKEEAWIAQWLTRRDLSRVGYTVERILPNPLRAAGIIAYTPVALYRGLEANKEGRGPLLPYLAKRMVSFFHRA